MFPEWTWIVGLAVGATIGSFLNVVIYRMPRGMSLSKPRFSFCPGCERQLTVVDLVPLLSWLALRGRCRTCGGRIAGRYALVELLCGALWAGLWWKFLIAGADPARAVAMAILGSVLLAAIFIDLRYFIIPDPLHAILLPVGALYNVVLYLQGSPQATTWGIPSSIAGALTGFALLWGIALFGRVLFRKDAMGHGDIKLARGIGAVLFPAAALVSFGLAIVLGALLGLVQVAARKRASDGAAEDVPAEEPESLGGLIWCGLGYLLLIDVLGLLVPRLYERWFGENPYDYEGIEESPSVDLTMIPFGPYLAAGALATVFLDRPIFAAIDSYLQSLQVAS